MIISGGIFENNKIEEKLQELDLKSSKEDFWKNKTNVKKILKEKNLYESIINSFKESTSEIRNLKDIYTLGRDENNEEIINDCISKVDIILNKIKKINLEASLTQITLIQPLKTHLTLEIPLLLHLLTLISISFFSVKFFPFSFFFSEPETKT